jgi:predicted O-methyltransferase YrrM
MRKDELHEIAQQSTASQDHEELEQLLLEVDAINPKYILEIGVHLGRSMQVWDRAFHPTWMYGLERDTCYDYSQIPGKVLKGVDSGNPETVWNVKELLDGHQIDFLFIDGDHLQDPVIKDFILYSSFVRDGGIIAFHDIRIDDNPTCEVFKFWREMKKQEPQYNYKEIMSKTGTGVGIIYK